MHVLDVRPGITDPASIKFHNENELMEQAEDPERHYIEVIMQEKIRLYLEWVDRLSLAISLREDADPRVEGEVERIINEIVWKG